MKLSADKIFTNELQKAIKDKVKEVEENTSAELRIFVDDHCKKVDPLHRAMIIFNKLEMDQTKLRNGVLIYLSITDHKFAIVGDKAIHEKVHDEFWNETKDLMLDYFKKNQIKEGLITGIEKIGHNLAIHFPKLSEDLNELEDEIVFGKDNDV